MNDKELRKCVIEQLDFEPSIQGSDIGVAVDQGVVTLSGHVKSFAEKWIVEKLASRVKGVKAIAMDVEVRYGKHITTTDDQIADRAVKLLAWNVLVPKASVTLTVENGWITLKGRVPWRYQSEAAEKAVRKLSGVVGVINHIALESAVQQGEIKQKILEAFKRDAELEARKIDVSVADNIVTLTGTVHAWHERDVAERAAWSAPGVTAVEDKLHVAA